MLNQELARLRRSLVPSQAVSVLCELVANRPSGTIEIDTRTAEQLWKLAQEHEVESIVAHRLATLNIPVPNRDRWQAAHSDWTFHISTFLHELDAIGDQLDRRKISVVALKNGGIARAIHPCPGCCPMGDLDLLVEPHHFEEAHEELLASGFRLEFRSELEEEGWEGAKRSGSAEYWKPLGDHDQRLWVELQSRAISGTWIAPHQEPATSDLMARAKTIPDSSVRVLASEDNLLQVAIHTAKHSYVRAPGLRLHTDVDRIVDSCTIDWLLFLRRAQNLHVRTAVYFSLAIPKIIFGTPIPNWVLHRLEPGALKRRVVWRMIRRAGLFHPHEKKFSRPFYIVFHLLLYDGMGAFRSIFPPIDWMRHRYEASPRAPLPYLYVKRLVDLMRRKYSGI